MATNRTKQRFSKYNYDQLKNMSYADFLNDQDLNASQLPKFTWQQYRDEAIKEWKKGRTESQYGGIETPQTRLAGESPYAPLAQSTEAQQFYFTNPSDDWFQKYKEAHPNEVFDEAKVKGQLQNRLKEFGKTPKGLLFEADLFNQAFERNMPELYKQEAKLYSNQMKNQAYNAASETKKNLARRGILGNSGTAKKAERELMAQAAVNIEQQVGAGRGIQNTLEAELKERKNAVTQAGLAIASMNLEQSKEYLNQTILDMQSRNSNVGGLFQGLGMIGGYAIGSNVDTKNGQQKNEISYQKPTYEDYLSPNYGVYYGE